MVASATPDSTCFCVNLSSVQPIMAAVLYFTASSAMPSGRWCLPGLSHRTPSTSTAIMGVMAKSNRHRLCGLAKASSRVKLMPAARRWLSSIRSHLSLPAMRPLSHMRGKSQKTLDLPKLLLVNVHL